MKTGHAKLTATTQHFLDICPAVTSWRMMTETEWTWTHVACSGACDSAQGGACKCKPPDPDVIFEYDETIEVPLVPEGVEF